MLSMCRYINTVCSLGEVKKSKPEKYTNKQVLKVCFAYYVTLYWDFWYFDNSLVIFFEFRCIGCPLPWNPVEPHMSPMEAIVPFCLPIWLHFGHIRPQMSDFGPLCPLVASIGTTLGPLYTPLGPMGPNLDWMGPLLSHSGHQLVHRGHMGLKWVPW